MILLSSDDAALAAMGPREVIGEAVGLLMARHHVSEGTALRILVEMLFRMSPESHEEVREIAATIVSRQGGPRPPE